jgi:hypothetical protein
MERTRYYSYKTGDLCKGCQLCVTGSKLVLFVTGICTRNCYYCPLSDEKKNKDLVFANEWMVEKDEDLLTEAELCSSKGAGITGGDPLLRLEKTIHYIKLLKEKFGKEFHIHLYTIPESITQSNLKELYEAGLDEIRFHPDLENNKNWNKISLAFDFKWDIGIEIPVIPGKQKQTEKLIEFILTLKPKINFINLNELEVSDALSNKLVGLGFVPKDEISYGVLGSEELALKLLKKYDKKINIHYCTAKLKDKIQLTERIKKRAKNIKKDYDFLTKEGSLIRGAIYLDFLKPGFDYHENLENLDPKLKNKTIINLKELKEKITKKLKIKSSMINIDELKLRILTSVSIVKKNKKYFKKLNLVPAVVEEYPTYDQMEVTVEFI